MSGFFEGLRARARRRAEVVEDALLAPRPPRDAHPPPMQDQPQRQPRPLLRWHHRGHLPLDLDRIPRGHELQPIRQADDMRIDSEPWLVEPVAEDYVGRLSSDARNF